jgi:hypothetical protein
MIPSIHERQSCINALHNWLKHQRLWQVRESLPAASEEQYSADVLHLWRPAKHPSAPTWVLSAGIHGDEPSGTFAIIEALLNDALGNAVHWSVWPLLNPSGFIRDRREDAAGRDLNRDFKTRRSTLVRFFIDAIERLDMPPTLHLSLHEDWEYAQGYLYEINSSDQPSLAQPLLQAIESTTGLLQAPLIDGHLPTSPGYIFHATEPDLPYGWPEAIYMVKRFPLCSYTVEAPGKAPFNLRMQMMHRAIAGLRACSEGQPPQPSAPPF